MRIKKLRGKGVGLISDSTNSELAKTIPSKEKARDQARAAKTIQFVFSGMFISNNPPFSINWRILWETIKSCSDRLISLAVFV